MRHILAILLCVCLASAAPGRGRVCVGFWNVENLFDTINNPLTQDDDYTPRGIYRWTGVRYDQKIKNLARVLDDMAMDVVGLAEVENRAVLEDLVKNCKTDYGFIHLTSSDRRGLDLALLYKGDKFFPDDDPALPRKPGPRGTCLVRTSYGREFLYVKGRLMGERVDLVVCHLPSNLNTKEKRRSALGSLYRFADSLQQADPAARPVIMGDLNASPVEKIMREEFHTGRTAMEGAWFMYNPFLKLAKEGLGSYVYKDRWRLYDNILLSPALLGGAGLRYESCGIFLREYMVGEGSSRQGYPRRSYVSGAYEGGFSDHLPVYVYFVF